MADYLYKITTKRTDGRSTNKPPSPVYYVAKSKYQVMQWALVNLPTGLAVAKINCLAPQIGKSCFMCIDGKSNSNPAPVDW